MAIIAPVFLLVLLALVELSLMFFATLTMQYAVREGARYAITGQSNLDPATKNQQRYAAVIESMRGNSLGFYDKLSTKVAVNGVGYTTANYSNSMFGAPGSIVVLQLTSEWQISTPLLSTFFKDGKYTFNVGATMQNEFF